MPTTRLSSKGQVTIPKPLRSLHNWNPGQKLQVIDTGGGIFLQATQPFEATTLAEVAGCLPYIGKPKTLDEMSEAIRRGVEETNRNQELTSVNQ